MLTKSVRIRHMDLRREREVNVAIGAAVLAGAAGAVSFFMFYIALMLAALNVGIIQIPLFNTHPEQGTLVMPTIITSSIVVAGIVAWLVFRLLIKQNRLPK